MTDKLNDLLRQTSRSFYLTLRVLPAAVRSQIGLAYLLARTTDTIADTEVLPPAQRLAALQSLRARILGKNTAPLDFVDLAKHQGDPAERALLENVEASLAELTENQSSAKDVALIRAVLDTITGGQELDLVRFSKWAGLARNDSRPLVALQSEAELDDYTYRVAGCVGEFWTRICRLHVFPEARLDEPKLLVDGIRFGKGLQLVNILRDLPADLRNGRCYLPADGLAALGLKPGDLLEPGNEPRLRPMYNEWLDRAEAHLAAGWNYTNSLPWKCVRVRLACAWPILIGMDTIARLRQPGVLDGQKRVKVSRSQVKWLMFKSIVTYPLPGVWRGLLAGAEQPA